VVKAKATLYKPNLKAAYFTLAYLKNLFGFCFVRQVFGFKAINGFALGL
jgi:hypothetical protein